MGKYEDLYRLGFDHISKEFKRRQMDGGDQCCLLGCSAPFCCGDDCKSNGGVFLWWELWTEDKFADRPPSRTQYRTSCDWFN
jgi:hypothetical protein